MAKTALCIGINNYPGTGNDLAGCVNDVNDWTKALEGRGFKVTQMVDKAATKNAMVEGIRKLVRDAKSGDVALLQYSGHGSWVPDEDGDEPDGRDEVLCPCDIGPEAFIRDDDLYDLFAERQSGVRIVFLSDSCHSGTVAKFAPMADVNPRLPRARFLPPNAFLPASRHEATARLARSPVRGSKPHQGLLISGCQDVQTSADAWFGDRPNGAFTYYALKALPGLPANATYRQWYAALREFLPSPVYTQRPNLFGTTSQRKWSVL